IAANCPNELFQEGGTRCADGNLPDLRLHLVRKDPNTVSLARLGLVLAIHRRGRHKPFSGSCSRTIRPRLRSPEAKRETRAKFQLYLYARALSVRTRIPLSRFSSAYFDDRDYFEVIVDSRPTWRSAA